MCRIGADNSVFVQPGSWEQKKEPSEQGLISAHLLWTPQGSCPRAKVTGLTVISTFLMGLLLQNLETCYSSINLVVSRLGTAQSLLTAMFVLFPAPFACMERFLLVATSYNDYLLVCHPLLSVTLLSWKYCLQKTAAPWLEGFLSSTAIILFLPKTYFVALACWTTSALRW